MPTLNFRFRAGFIVGLLILLLIGCPAPRGGDVPGGTNKDEQRAARVIGEVLRMYQQKDLIGVMNRVAPGYLGDRARLERNLNDQLQSVDSFEYEWFVTQVVPGGDDRVIEVEFRWDRRWRDVDTGNETRASGTATFRLVRERGQWLIKDIRGDNPFL